MPYLKRSDFTYTALFCEENIWKLIESLYINQLAQPIDVLFVINKNNTIALFEQKLSLKSKPIIWDYHVILTALIENELVVFDFDTNCHFPSSIYDYFHAIFPNYIQIKSAYQPLIKSIPAKQYFEYFYSDRLHMQGIIDNSKFPQYPIISPDNDFEKLTLEQCRSTKNTGFSSTLFLPNDYLTHIKL